INESGEELASQLNYRFRDSSITPAQGDELLKARAELDELIKEETEVNAQRHKIGHAAADARIADIAKRRDEVLEPLRQFIPAELQNEIQEVVREYRRDKADQLDGGHASARVAEYIDLDSMNNWLDQVAPAHFKAVEARHALLFTDRETFLPRHAQGT
ncbi:hypothetical protein NNO07_28045, partial [Pseudomonas resinovorans]|nr:hypothetical protein [Pseudomonas resinovorans]